MNQPRPISSYSTDEVEAIVLKEIAVSQLTAGYYYNLETDTALTIEKLSHWPKGVPQWANYMITFRHHYYSHSFFTKKLSVTRMATA